MKKLISLLLAVMLVMSVMSFNVMASSDTQLVVADGKPAEDELAVGTLPTTGADGIYYGKTGAAVAVMPEGSTNKVFVLNGTKTANNGSSLVSFRPKNMVSTSNFMRFTAKVMVPTIDDTDAMVGVHMPARAAGTSSGRYNGFGVFLTNGGAQYWDSETSKLVYFIPQGTMEANKWYRVEAIMDTREATANLDTSTNTTDSVLYMSAFVYDGETNALVGASGWKKVSNGIKDNTNYLYSATHKGFYNVYIQAYKFPADNGNVYVDEFNAYGILNAPEYELSAEVDRSVAANKYVEIDNSTTFNKTVGHMFNVGASNYIIRDTSANKAARVEMNVRIPEFSENAQFDFYRLYSSNAGKQMPTIASDSAEGTRIIDGTIQINGNALTVNAYDASADAYNTPVALNVGSSLEIDENEWYTFVWDMDYTDFENPTAMVYIKNDRGELVAQTASAYAIQPIPKNKWNQWACVLILGTAARKTQKWQFDNTNLYSAETVAGLSDEATRKVHVENTFEDYDLGTNYHTNIVANEYNGAAPAYVADSATVSAPVFVWEDGMQVDTTDPLIFTYEFTKPMPVTNINANNVEIYANGVKLNSGYTITPGEQDANGCVTTFTVNTGALNWDTEYSVRLKADVVDYNAALSGGIPAVTGLYDEVTFSVAAITPDCVVDAIIVDTESLPYESETLTSGDVIKGRISVTNNDDGKINCYGILAIYDGNKLVDAKRTAHITVPAGETVDADTSVYTATKDGLTAKLFVWNNFELMTPWIAPVSLGQ